MYRQQAFTLIELMIVVAIIGILASIAYPNYQDSVKKSRRADAKAALLGLANAMERYYTENNTYLGAAGTAATPADTGAPRIFATESPIDGADKFYDLEIQDATQTTYNLRATPKNAQQNDYVLELNNTETRGRQGIVDSGAVFTSQGSWD